MENNLAIDPARTPFNRNMDLRLAVNCAFTLDTSPKIMTFMGTFIGQPIHQTCCLVISCYGAV
jgi:hypothetical protein